MRLRMLPVDVPDVITLHLSWPVPLAASPREEILDQTAVALLDRGAARRDEEAVAAYLEDRGVELHFTCDSTRVRCQVRMLKRHLSDIIPLLVDCMTEPRMDASSMESVSLRLRSNLMQARSRTAARAGIGLRRQVFEPGHPEYAWEVDERLAELDIMTAEDVATWYRQRLLPALVHATIVGDVGAQHARQVSRGISSGVGSGLEEFPRGERHAPDSGRTIPELSAAKPVRLHIPLADRSNVDVRMGHGVDIRRRDEDYDALKTGVFALGGNFSARLMATVRDRDGLTYGIGSTLSGVEPDWPGMWVTSLSLSAPDMSRGIDSALAEIRTFIRDGISKTERQTVVGTLTGSARVQLGTTSGLARVLLRHLERGDPASEIDAWPRRIEALTTERINDAVRTWLDVEKLHVISAGSTGH